MSEGVIAFGLFVFFVKRPHVSVNSASFKGKKCEVIQTNWVVTFEPLLVTTGHPHEGLCVSFGGFPETFAVRIFAQAFEDGADCAGEPLFPF